MSTHTPTYTHTDTHAHKPEHEDVLANRQTAHFKQKHFNYITNTIVYFAHKGAAKKLEKSKSTRASVNHIQLHLHNDY